jgi:hypothetical protein
VGAGTTPTSPGVRAMRLGHGHMQVAEDLSKQTQTRGRLTGLEVVAL